MDFKEYLREEEERVDEILPAIAAIGGGIARGASVVGRGLVGGAKAATGSAKQFMVDKAKKKAIKKAGEVAQNTLAPGEQQAEVTRMYITKAGVKFISEARKKIPKGLFNMEAHQKHMAEVKRQEELAKETKGLVRK